MNWTIFFSRFDQANYCEEMREAKNLLYEIEWNYENVGIGENETEKVLRTISVNEAKGPHEVSWENAQNMGIST